MNLRTLLALLAITDFSYASLPNESSYFSMAQLHRPIQGMGPVVGMPCAAGYRLVGDECVIANIPFD